MQGKSGKIGNIQADSSKLQPLAKLELVGRHPTIAKKRKSATHRSRNGNRIRAPGRVRLPARCAVVKWAMQDSNLRFLHVTNSKELTTMCSRTGNIVGSMASSATRASEDIGPYSS